MLHVVQLVRVQFDKPDALFSFSASRVTGHLCSYFVISDISCMVFAKKETTVDIPTIWPTANLQPWSASSFRRETVCLETAAGKDTTSIEVTFNTNAQTSQKLMQLWCNTKVWMFWTQWYVQSQLPQSEKSASSCQWSCIITSFLKVAVLSAKWQHSSSAGGASQKCYSLLLKWIWHLRLLLSNVNMLLVCVCGSSM